MLRAEPLRSPAVQSALEAALTAKRAHWDFFAVLCRLSGLPGPRFNEALAVAVGRAIEAQGARGEALVQELCSVDARRAPAGTDGEFLPLVGAFCRAVQVASGRSRDAALASLRALAEDERHLVREGVVHALAEVGAEDLVLLLAQWTDGYLAATVALQALTRRSCLDALRDGAGVVARFEEAFALAEGASRSDQRSQGYRALVKVLSEAPARLLSRFPRDTLAWLESKAATSDVELREALSELTRRARSRGQATDNIGAVEQALDASAPARRDPKTYVGPTRKRGSRRR
ncbi:MAG TPA: hypothetical protein VJT73_05840 [Polyangiaceae bacterium]|nr:hypothetical protein [Polyangiaceae bacterium]